MDKSAVETCHSHKPLRLHFIGGWWHVLYIHHLVGLVLICQTKLSVSIPGLSH